MSYISDEDYLRWIVGHGTGEMLAVRELKGDVTVRVRRSEIDGASQHKLPSGHISGGARREVTVSDRTAGAALREQLGADLAALGELSESESAELLDMIERISATQRTALDNAIAEVLGKLPRLIRGPARKIMFG